MKKMKIIGVNSLPVGSPANIMRGILEVAHTELDASVQSFYGAWKNCPSEYMGSRVYGYSYENYLSFFIGKYLGLPYQGSYLGTLNLIHKVKGFEPDIIHLHNLHLSTINLELFFGFIRSMDYRVVWTLHDCWSFTGRCAHFQMTNCNKWKKGCNKCSLDSGVYPQSMFDVTEKMWRKKKKLFSGHSNLTIVTPSKWLTNLVKDSFLNQYNIITINNGIDLDVFKPRDNCFKDKHNINGKFMVLGVSFSWSDRKGYDIFLKLSKILDERYIIVLVGISDTNIGNLPKNIIAIEKTNNQIELSEIYSAADVFVNPTREDNYPTVNMEAIACGLPVITFSTGGSPEILDKDTGFVVEKDDVENLVEKIKYVCERKCFSKEIISDRAKKFDMHKHYLEYVDLYKSIMKI